MLYKNRLFIKKYWICSTIVFDEIIKSIIDEKSNQVVL
jgi:hypothetical protein